MNNVELSALDRSTLRLWRTSNLVGWGVVGAVVAMVASMLTLRIWVVVVPWRGLGGTLAVAALAVATGALADGVIVGAHVYRWPGWVAAGGFVLPALLGLLLSAPNFSAVEVLTISIAPGIGACLAALVARWRFRRRPRALRAPAAR